MSLSERRIIPEVLYEIILFGETVVDIVSSPLTGYRFPHSNFTKKKNHKKHLKMKGLRKKISNFTNSDTNKAIPS